MEEIVVPHVIKRYSRPIINPPFYIDRHVMLSIVETKLSCRVPLHGTYCTKKVLTYNPLCVCVCVVRVPNLVLFSHSYFHDFGFGDRNRRRIQNMILVVGPGTPASVLYSERNGEEDDSSIDDFSDDDDDDDDQEIAYAIAAVHENDDDEDSDMQMDDSDPENQDNDVTAERKDDHGMVSTHEELSASRTNDAGNTNAAEGELEEDDSENDSLDSSSDDEETGRHRYQRVNPDSADFADFRRETLRLLRRRLQSLGEGSVIESPRQASEDQNSRQKRRVRPSLRHGGCINTACWLNAPWRLSTVREEIGMIHTSSEYVDSEECPTQLLTSGDDRLVQVWDVSEAMGIVSPWEGGWNTFAPFSDEIPDTTNLQRRWNNRRESKLPGSVLNLAALSTGHRGNVFHVTPIPSKPGNVLTCGADGYLRLTDLTSQQRNGSSSVIMHPYMDEDDDDMGLQLMMHSRMAFSHHLLTTNTGLLCSERGLHLFDLRLSPREQNSRSLLNRQNNRGGGELRRRANSSACKACAVWYPPSHSALSTVRGLPQTGEVESHYVFAGGPGATVSLFDLRMGGSGAKVVETYRPVGLDTNSEVSVSGLDVSKDGRELLVSYESDQIYSFPIAHRASLYPSIDEIDSLSNKCEKGGSDSVVPELASYGGHLNRFTFLKNALYAGPNDEYICTGSDSGHAWIFERSTGTVAALLGADTSTCNGVVPHPSLPFFISYGIDSTAKLWRASPPVNPSTDDSSPGRAKRAITEPYEMSPVTKTWEGVQCMLKVMDDEPAMMPDYVASSDEVAASGRFSSPCRQSIYGGAEAPRIGNAIHALPSILRQNRYECYKAFHDEMDAPVEHPLIDFTHRVSLARLRFQADKLGLKWDPWSPWILQKSPTNDKVHPADRIPDNPSDWINFDSTMKSNALHPREQFGLGDPYDSELLARHIPGFFDSKDDHDGSIPWLQDDVIGSMDVDPKGSEGAENGGLQERSQRLLYATCVLLKEGGNEASKEGLLNVAARRYDKAIQYCAVALMRYYDGEESLKHLTEGHLESQSNAGRRRASNVIVNWSPLLRVLITSRLNLALILLRPNFLQPGRAAAQARTALKLLSPFCVQEGKVIRTREKKDYILKDLEPLETFKEAKALQAKAYYRLGSAELESGDYASAIKNFEASLLCAPSGADSKPDALTVKRLQEAKRKHKSKKKRDRAKFQRLYCLSPSTGDTGGENGGNTPPDQESST